MSNKALTPAKSRVIWTVNKKAHKAQALEILRSKSKIDGFPLPMVGVPCPFSRCCVSSELMLPPSWCHHGMIRWFCRG